MAKDNVIRLCSVDAVMRTGSKGFTLSINDERLEMFVVHSGGKYYGYKNRCPHTGAPLEWTPDQFLDHEGTYIQCAMHGALFLIDSGECVRGPCVGRWLDPIGVIEDTGELVLNFTDQNHRSKG